MKKYSRTELHKLCRDGDVKQICEELYDEITLSSTEKQVITEYRKADDVTKEMVHRVLHIEEKKDSEKMA